MKKGIMLLLILLLSVGCHKTLQDPPTPTYQGDEIENDLEEAPTPITKTPQEPGGVWYEIFVRSFADGDGDGIGDFIGLTDKLDYIASLGVEGIWLMPINPSTSYHGYDVTDYYDIHEDYGTLEDFKNFLLEAHKRDIKVIMDLVINHTGREHPWFKAARSNPDSEYRDYYHWITQETQGYDLTLQVWGHNVWNKVMDAYYYAIFWDGMPDLNFENSAVREEIKQIGKYWIDFGVDGFRMDAAMHIYGQGESPKGTNQSEANLAWWEEFDSYIREVKPDYYLVGEVWDDIYKRARYAHTFDSTFNFDVAEDSILMMVKTERDEKLQNNRFAKNMAETYERLKQVNQEFVDAPFLSNHDQNRAMGYFKSHDYDSMKLAASILLTLPGNPFLYYGEEIGMLGNKPDERIREPFIWGDDDYQTSWQKIIENQETISVSEQEADQESLLNFYREIIQVRNKSNVLRAGEFVLVETSNEQLISYKRVLGDEQLYILHNLKKETLSFSMDELEEELLTLYYNTKPVNIGEGNIIEIPAQGTVILGLK